MALIYFLIQVALGESISYVLSKINDIVVTYIYLYNFCPLHMYKYMKYGTSSAAGISSDIWLIKCTNLKILISLFDERNIRS